jgi:hypothetical protein
MHPRRLERDGATDGGAGRSRPRRAVVQRSARRSPYVTRRVLVVGESGQSNDLYDAQAIKHLILAHQPTWDVKALKRPAVLAKGKEKALAGRPAALLPSTDRRQHMRPSTASSTMPIPMRSSRRTFRRLRSSRRHWLARDAPASPRSARGSSRRGSSCGLKPSKRLGKHGKCRRSSAAATSASSKTRRR